MVENNFNKNIKSIISKGGEYIKGYFQSFCESEGIRMEHSVPYTPQQNGVSDRKNRSVKEMATCLLHAKHLPPSLWACCSCNYFPNFLKFWTLLLILACLDLFGIAKLCCSFATFWVVWSWIEIKLFLLLFRKLFFVY